jgi:hypothetical protein
LILLKKLSARGGDPLIELRGVPDGEACQEPGDLGGERPPRLLQSELAEVTDLALDRLGELDDRAIAADGLP